jgi:hypothetical protein
MDSKALKFLTYWKELSPGGFLMNRSNKLFNDVGIKS